MRRGAWLHQFNQQAEQTPADYAATLLPRGIDTIYAKAMDGDAWMGNFYSHPLAPAGHAQFAQLVAAFAAVGLELIAWVVPRFSAAEATSHEAAASAGSGKLVIDWEYHYAGFWQGSLAEAEAYFRNLRSMVSDGTDRKSVV